MSQRKPGLKFAVCINNEGYPASLELHKIYRIIPDRDAAAEDDIRVIDESGEDYLYPANWFVFVELPRAVEKSLRAA
ncbi:MAG: hypothetical protein ABR556_10480 [Pyrinomonadaceae bacterium]